MNPLEKHYLRYAKEWWRMSVSDSEHIDKAFCEHRMWVSLLCWIQEVNEE